MAWQYAAFSIKLSQKLKKKCTLARSCMTGRNFPSYKNGPESCSGPLSDFSNRVMSFHIAVSYFDFSSM